MGDMVNTGFEIKMENLHLGLLSKPYMPKDILLPLTRDCVLFTARSKKIWIQMAS